MVGQPPVERGPDPDEPERISPELALVDPDLAYRARFRLPDYAADARNGQVGRLTTIPETRRDSSSARVVPLLEGEAARDDASPPRPSWQQALVAAVERQLEHDRGRAGEGESQPEVEPGPSEWRRSTRRSRLRVASALVGFALTGALAFTIVTLTGDGREQAFVGGRTSQTKADPPARGGKKQSAKRGKPQSPSRTSGARAAPGSRTDARLQLRPDPKAPPDKALPAFVWAPVAGADAYDVQFFRGATKVYAVETSQTRLTLATEWSYGGSRFRLTPGSYRWYVWPIFRSGSSVHRGKPIVQTTLVITR